MTSIYIKDTNGKKVAVSVTEEIKAVDLETRRAIWRNDAKEKYYCSDKLNNLNEKDREMCSNTHNPEIILTEKEHRTYLKAEMIAMLKTLTERQLTVLKLLKQGRNKAQIAKVLGVTKQSVQDVHESIKKKFKKLL